LLVAVLATTKGDTVTVTAVTGLQELDLVVFVVVVVGHRWLVLFEMNKLEFIGWPDLLSAEGGRYHFCFHGGWTIKVQCSRMVDDDTGGWISTSAGLVIRGGCTNTYFFTEGGEKWFIDLGGWTRKYSCSRRVDKNVDRARYSWRMGVDKNVILFEMNEFQTTCCLVVEGGQVGIYLVTRLVTCGGWTETILFSRRVDGETSLFAEGGP
jgi:hypothetical protein